MPRSTQPLTVLALGSSHGDDQIAWSVADHLSADPSFHGACARLTSAWDVIPFFQSNGATIIIDACRSGAPAGTIYRVTAREMPAQAGMSASTHGVTLADALRLAESLGYDASQTVIYAIEMEACQPGAPLSDFARRAAEQLATRIREELLDRDIPR